jgi:hypothetical protein
VKATDFGVSWLPALSIEYHWIEWAAEPEAGAATAMVVPWVNVGAASSFYQWLATPEPPVSAPESVKVWDPV